MKTEFGEWSIKCDRDSANKARDYAKRYAEKYPNDKTHFDTLMRDAEWLDAKASNYYAYVKMLKEKGYKLLPGE